MSRRTLGFGYDPLHGQSHFLVLPLPKATPRSSALIQVYECFAFNNDCEGKATSPVERTLCTPSSSDILRLELSKPKWDMVKSDLTAEFNARLRSEGVRVGKFSASEGTHVERLFGKEMMILLWSIEESDPSLVPVAVRNWKGLLPEERWWLYTMTNAATGGIHDRIGWRTALRYALCENPLVERKRATTLVDTAIGERKQLSFLDVEEVAK